MAWLRDLSVQLRGAATVSKERDGCMNVWACGDVPALAGNALDASLFSEERQSVAW